MSEKMILIPYSEYQELVNRPDKIRAEIEQEYKLECENPYGQGLRRAIEIIDKYKAEKSCRDCKYDTNDVYGYCFECFLKIQDHYERKNKE